MFELRSTSIINPSNRRCMYQLLRVGRAIETARLEVGMCEIGREHRNRHRLIKLESDTGDFIQAMLFLWCPFIISVLNFPGNFELGQCNSLRTLPRIQSRSSCRSGIVGRGQVLRSPCEMAGGGHFEKRLG